MGAVSLVFAALSYAAAAVLVGGLCHKLWVYAVTPNPLKIPVTPAPVSIGGVVLKNAVVIGLFTSLFKGNRWTWVGGYALHILLLFVFVRHLRFFVHPVSPLLAEVQPYALMVAMLFPLPLIYLLVRRKMVDRYDYISSPADHFVLLLLLGVGLSGLSLKFLNHADVVAVKEFLLSLMALQPASVPLHGAFLVHYSLVLILAFYFPFSKLLHAGGVFFSPTRVQADDPRERRHVNPWAGR